MFPVTFKTYLRLFRVRIFADGFATSVSSFKISIFLAKSKNRLEMAQNEKVFCDESLNRRRYRLGVKKQNVALDETFQMSLLGAS